MEKYKYACKCGKMGFVEVADGDNRYPCRECYLEIVRNRNLRFQGRDEFKNISEAQASADKAD